MNKRKCIFLSGILLIGIMAFGSGRSNAEEEKAQELFEGFSEMNYVLFLETNTGYDVSLNYFRYGLYGNMVKNEQEGEELYFALNEKILNKTLSLADCEENPEDKTEESQSWAVHEKWAHNTEEIITDISTDAGWVVTREYGANCDGSYVERWYHNAELERKFDGNISDDPRQFVQHKTENGTYEPLSLETAKQLLERHYGKRYMEESHENWLCFDTEGKLLAVADQDEYGQGCGSGISIYSIEEGSAGFLCYLERAGAEAIWPIEISQISGDRERGWIVFSQGDETYKMTYPTGEIEKIGAFMYGTSYSPDGKYLAYCTGNVQLFEMWETMDEEPYDILYRDLKSRWDKVPAGWYVEELETGNKTYIPMPVWSTDYMPLYGGRCVWIEKERLDEILCDFYQ